MIQPLWKMVWRFLKRLGIKPPYDPAIPLLPINPKETKTEKDTCTPLFIAALFIIARTWKQPRCPLADKWIRKMWYIYTIEYYSAIKKNAFESVLMRWRASPVPHRVKNLPAIQETWVQFLGWEDPLEKEMATHSSILAWKIP